MRAEGVTDALGGDSRTEANSDGDHNSAAMFSVNARASDVRLWVGLERFPDLSRGALGARGKVGMKEFLNPRVYKYVYPVCLGGGALIPSQIHRARASWAGDK